MTVRWAEYEAAFDREPRTPAEIRERDRLKAAWEARARQNFAARVQMWSDRYTAAMQIVNEFRYAMDLGGAKKVGAGTVPLERHISAYATAEQELARARAEAHAAVDEIARLRAGDPVQMYEAMLAKYPAMASRVSIEDPQS